MQVQKSQPLNPIDTTDCISASELVHRHLNDKDHEISESELQKVALDCNDIPTATSKANDGAPDAISIAMNATIDEGDKDDKEDEKQEKPILPTPLDILS